MLRFAVECLRTAGVQMTVAWYAPFREEPSLSRPLPALGLGPVRSRRQRLLDGLDGYAIGARLPELEFNTYYPNRVWKNLIEEAGCCFAVSGNFLAARPFAGGSRSFLAWLATPWREDRRQREAAFGPIRRAVDAMVVRPAMERLERRILSQGTLMALSEYTSRQFEQISQTNSTRRVLPVPVDPERFLPSESATVRGRIGFMGRLNDPRKRVPLLLRAAAECRKKGHDITVFLMGGALPAVTEELVDQLELRTAVHVHPYVPDDELPGIVRTFDVFLLSSAQEGLCIAALEAMSCAVPVVSTRCGGPEEFVLDGETGVLVGDDPREMADAVCRISTDRALRKRLGANARSLVEKRYSLPAARETLLEGFQAAFGSLL